MKYINFTPEKLELLKNEYQKAVTTGSEVFIFEGSEVLTTYAKYLIEYLSEILKPK
jgi:hypothetical protein